MVGIKEEEEKDRKKEENVGGRRWKNKRKRMNERRTK